MTGRTGIFSLGVAALLTAALLLFTLKRAAKETPSGAVHVVAIQGMQFVPARIEIAPGDSVTWVNRDILMHAAKSTDPKNAWQSTDLQPQQSWTRSFASGDSYPYMCPYHPTMTGEIVIKESHPSVSSNSR